MTASRDQNNQDFGNCNFLAPKRVLRSAEGGVKTTLINLRNTDTKLNPNVGN